MQDVCGAVPAYTKPYLPKSEPLLHAKVSITCTPMVQDDCSLVQGQHPHCIHTPSTYRYPDNQSRSSCCSFHSDTCLDVAQHVPCQICRGLPCKALGSRTRTTERFPHIPFQSFVSHRADSTVQDRMGACRMTLADHMSTSWSLAVHASSACPHRHNRL